MESITLHPLFPYIGLFILGMLASMAAFGSGLGAFITTKTLVNLLNKLAGVSQYAMPGVVPAKKSEIQKNKETPCGQKCKHYAKKGKCKDDCTISAKLAELQPKPQTFAATSIEPIVSQHQHRAPEIFVQSEIQTQTQDITQQPGAGFLGGDNDCYSYCKIYNETGGCPPGCPMILNQ